MIDEILEKCRPYKEWIIGAVVLVSLTAFISLGYGHEIRVVDGCVASVTRYHTAEFSEMTVGIDMDGNAYTDTDYWSEPASDVFRIITVNGEPQSDGGTISPNGAYYPPYPQKDLSFRSQMYFDNFEAHSDSSLTIHTIKGDVQDEFSESIASNGDCIDKLGLFIMVKLWYGISYGSNF